MSWMYDPVNKFVPQHSVLLTVRLTSAFEPVDLQLADTNHEQVFLFYPPNVNGK